MNGSISPNAVDKPVFEQNKKKKGTFPEGKFLLL